MALKQAVVLGLVKHIIFVNRSTNHETFMWSNMVGLYIMSDQKNDLLHASSGKKKKKMYFTHLHNLPGLEDDRCRSIQRSFFGLIITCII
jgi:hypothetical protein